MFLLYETSNFKRKVNFCVRIVKMLNEFKQDFFNKNQIIVIRSITVFSIINVFGNTL